MFVLLVMESFGVGITVGSFSFSLVEEVYPSFICACVTEVHGMENLKGDRTRQV